MDKVIASLENRSRELVTRPMDAATICTELQPIFAKIGHGFLRTSLRGSSYEIGDLVSEGALVLLGAIASYPGKTETEYKKLAVWQYINHLRTLVSSRYRQKRKLDDIAISLDDVEFVLSDPAHEKLYTSIFISELLSMLSRIDQSIMNEYLFGCKSQELAEKDSRATWRRRGINVVRVRPRHVAQALGISERAVNQSLKRVSAIAKRNWTTEIESPFRRVRCQ